MISFGELHQVVADDEEWEFDEVELDTTSVRRQDIGDAGVVRWHDLNLMYRRGWSSVYPLMVCRMPHRPVFRIPLHDSIFCVVSSCIRYVHSVFMYRTHGMHPPTTHLNQCGMRPPGVALHRKTG